MYDDFGFIFNKNAIFSKMIGGLVGFFNRKKINAALDLPIIFLNGNCRTPVVNPQSKLGSHPLLQLHILYVEKQET